MPYSLQYGLAILVSIAIVVLPLSANAAMIQLGLTEKDLAWVVPVMAFLGVLASFLPKVTQRPNEARVGMD